MIWFIYALMSIIANIIAYITNPIVCLFADEYGNLPKALRYWQTFDNCLDIDWMIDEEVVPKIFRYDFHKHYIYHMEDKDNYRIIPGYVEIIDPNFTFKEKVQRYFCRLAWLYRNTAYGFDWEFTARTYKVADIVIVKKTYVDEYNHVTISYDKSKNIFNGLFKVFIYKQWCSKFYLRIYWGWKLTDSKENIDGKTRSSLAFFFMPFRMVK